MHYSVVQVARELTLLRVANNLAPAGCTLTVPVREPWDAAVNS